MSVNDWADELRDRDTMWLLDKALRSRLSFLREAATVVLSERIHDEQVG